MSKITLVPTSHIARESLERVRGTINKENPDCVAVELDINRYQYLRVRKKEKTFDILRVLGIPTFLLYWILKKFQDYFGKKTGIFPGSEMLEAVKIAKEKNITIAFIDLPIEITLARIKALPLTEKLKIFKLLLMSIVGLALPFKGSASLDLNKVPPQKVIDQAMDYLRKEMPGFYRILVSERNKVMSKNLMSLTSRFDNIVCVIGAGHEKGMKKMLKIKV